MRRPRMLAGVVATALAASVVLAVTAPTVVAAPVAPVAFTSNSLATWQTDGIVWAMAQAGGKVFAGGSFTAIRPPGTAAGGAGEQPAVNFAEFDAATGDPTGCGLSFTVSSGTATVRALAVSPDGRTLYAGGYFDHVNGAYVNSLVAIDIATCALKPGFAPQVNATVRTITPTATGVYFGGDFTSVDGQTRTRLAQVTTDGTLTGWAPTADKPVRASVLSPDGSMLVVGGDFDRLDGADSHALGIVDAATGATAKTYPLGFIEQNSVVKALTSDATGFYTGNEGTGGGVFDGRIAIDWSTLGQRWRDTCLGATQAVISYQGVLYAGSHTHDCSSMGEQPDGRRQHLIAEPTTTGMELPWAPDTNDGIGEQIGPRALTIATEDDQPYLWVSGEFTTVNGTAQQGLTRFGTGPDKAPPTAPAMGSTSSVGAGTVQLRWLASTDTDDGTLSYSVYRDGSTTPVWTGTAASYWWSRPQVSFTDSGLAPGSYHTYRITASDGTNVASSPVYTVKSGTATSGYAARVVSDGANLYWRYDEPSGGFIGDSAGEHNGTFNGGGTYRDGTGALTGDPSYPLGLNGSTGFVATAAAQPTPSQYSVETWFKTTTRSGGLLVGFGNSPTAASSSYDKHVYMTNSGQLVFGVYSGGTQTVTSPAAYNDGAWHHVVATQGADGMALYVDGLRVGRNAAVTTSQQYTGYWHVGGDSLGSWPNQPSSAFFQGDVDETAVYPSVLSAAQVAAHYDLGSGASVAPGPSDPYGKAVYGDAPDSYWRLDESSGYTAADASGNDNTGVYGLDVARGTASAVAGTTDTAATLDGNFFSIVSSATATAAPAVYSTELWFRTTGTQGGKLIGFGDSQNGMSGTFDRHVYMTNDGHLVFGVRNAEADTVTSPAAYNDGAWHYLVATQGADGMKLYVDGAAVASNGVSANRSYTGYWRVGGDNLSGWPQAPTGDFFRGGVDEAAVYSTELTAAQVAAHYAAGAR
ncbi:LamG domain-containing protein [Streptantibioticus silvisoli]|uniref:LamG domain-containing protein n=1 Tax=Streptantibioticus silvisoli TaxID=2705255 RepID=A0ABT6W0X9_9ACTN|nr:LamG domain-containing protein [Streptantibioticus silvisoli]MDI5964409.1 LamG domain-containing protein [Streptantibioticus silvisoli]